MKRFSVFALLLSFVTVLGCEPAKPAKIDAPKVDATVPADGAPAADPAKPADEPAK